jgi:MSHA pilin protein MshC
MKKNDGFTVTELIVTLVLIGILSAFVIARFLSVDTYNAIIIRDQIVSLSQSAQQRAIGRSDVKLTLQPVASDLEIRLEDSGGVIQSVRTSLAGVAITADINNQASCVTPPLAPITNAAPFVLNYNRLGDLLNGGMSDAVGFPVQISSGARVCIDSNPLMSVCLSSAGFAYVGDCVD